MAQYIEAAATPQPLPLWLRTRLIDQVGLSAAAVDALTLEQAVDNGTTWSNRG